MRAHPADHRTDLARLLEHGPFDARPSSTTRDFAPDDLVARGGDVTERGVSQTYGYWSPARTEVMRRVLNPSQCIRPT